MIFKRIFPSTLSSAINPTPKHTLSHTHTHFCWDLSGNSCLTEMNGTQAPPPPVGNLTLTQVRIQRRASLILRNQQVVVLPWRQRTHARKTDLCKRDSTLTWHKGGHGGYKRQSKGTISSVGTPPLVPTPNLDPRSASTP